MDCTGNRTFFAFRVSCIIMIIIALTLHGTSLRRDAKWDQYVTGAVEAQEKHPIVFQIKAHQSLWKLTVLADYNRYEDSQTYTEESLKVTGKCDIFLINMHVLIFIPFLFKISVLVKVTVKRDTSGEILLFWNYLSNHIFYHLKKWI